MDLWILWTDVRSVKWRFESSFEPSRRRKLCVCVNVFAVCVFFIAFSLLCHLLRALCGPWPSAWHVALWRWCTWRRLVTTWTDLEWCSEPVPGSLMSWSWQERWPIRWLQLCGRWGRESVRCNSSILHHVFSLIQVYVMEMELVCTAHRHCQLQVLPLCQTSLSAGCER